MENLLEKQRLSALNAFLTRAGDDDDDEDDDDEKEPCSEKKDGGGNALEMKLLKSRSILVAAPVNDKLYASIYSRVLFLEQEDPKKEITLYVNCPGGSADAGFGIYDLLKFVSCPIRSICAGLCASAAVLIYLGAEKGRRIVLPHSRFLLHQPSTTVMGQASDMEISAKEIVRTRSRYAEVIADEIGRDAQKVIDDSKRDFWLNAQEAVDYGLADKLVIERKEL